ncbi:MAG: deoxyribonuclease IV [Phycisphaerales bacterium]|nr:deoxyribonuclease IV [Phycisphaerales bacterium]
MFGSHLSIAGSMLAALDEARALDLDTVQVFTKNQQQWACKPLPTEAVAAWRGRMKELGWEGRTVSHASYLINLASPDDALWAKSIDLMEEEIRRCELLGIPYLVHHPGAFTTSTREQGLERIAAAYTELFARTKKMTVVSCLENTVGSGSNLGREFTELATLRDLIITATGRPERIGVCFDTCHAHAGGYDLSGAEKAAGVMRQLDAELGLEWVKVVHVNDSKAAAGSRRDLHEHIGEGTIGLPGFEGVVAHPTLKNVPKILETPKGDGPDGVPLDTVNLRRLYSLLQGGPINQPVTGTKSPPRGPKTPARKPAATKGRARGRATR